MNMIKSTYALALLALPLALQGQMFNFMLSGSQASTAGTPTGSAGFATVNLDGTTLDWSVTYEGISSLNAAHFHGPAGTGATAGVSQGITVGASPIVGSATLTAGKATVLLAGNWSRNLHTPENTGGELRGQVVNTLSFTPNMLLSGSQVVGINAVGSAGAALVVFNTSTNELSWDIAYEGLSGTTTAAHFHGPAAAGVNGGVQVNINPTTGISADILSGSTVLSDQGQIDDLLAGLWYINIHSTVFPGGEIRGQVSPTIVPEPSVFAILSSVAALLFVIGYRRIHSQKQR